MSERVFTLQEIEEAIEEVEKMFRRRQEEGFLETGTVINQMGRYIKRHLIETPSRKQGEAKEIELHYDKKTGFIGEGEGT